MTDKGWAGVGVTYDQRADRRRSVDSDRFDGSREKLVGAGIAEGNTAVRAPPDMVRQRLDQGIGSQDHTALIEHQGWQADQTESFAGGAGPFQLEPRRH